MMLSTLDNEQFIIVLTHCILAAVHFDFEIVAVQNQKLTSGSEFWLRWLTNSLSDPAPLSKGYSLGRMSSLILQVTYEHLDAPSS